MQPTSAPLPSRCPCCALWPGEPVGCSPMDDRRPTPSDLWSHVPDARAVLCCRGAWGTPVRRALLQILERLGVPEVWISSCGPGWALQW